MSPRTPARLRVLAIGISLGIVLALALLPIADATTSAGSLLAAPSPLRVSGNRLVNAASQPIQLRGVNRIGFEYSCVRNIGLVDGPVDQASVDAIKSWRVNAVRLPLNEHCWLGINGAPSAYSGVAYQQAIKDYVSLLNQNGLYAILDLHWSGPGMSLANGPRPMPNADHSPTFWSQVAAAFKGNDAVIFDLFNAPVPNNNVNVDTEEAARRSWECWRDGGTASCDATLSLGPPETAMSASQAVGMQTLVDAVRGTGATNVILVGGIQWANTLWTSAAHNWLSYRPTDPRGNLAAAVHIYSFARCTTVACYDSDIAPVAAQAPVITGEFGIGGCDAAAAQWLNTLLSWFDGHQVGYLAFVWNAPDGCTNGNLIADWDGTPSQYGQIYKTHLDGLR
jgi:endoglucanase